MPPVLAVSSASCLCCLELVTCGFERPSPLYLFAAVFLSYKALGTCQDRDPSNQMMATSSGCDLLKLMVHADAPQHGDVTTRGACWCIREREGKGR